MRVELRVTSGSRAGQRELFDKSVIAIGRHPMNDFRFHPELDPDVSSRHAELRVLGEKATIHDLDSTNGTFVNGQRVAGERALFSGDLVSFGVEGPKVEFRVGAESREPGAESRERANAGKQGHEPGAGSREPAKAGAPRRDTIARIAEAVERQTGKLRAMVMAVAALAVVGVGGAWWMGHRDAARAQAGLDLALKRNDSLSAAFEQSVRAMRGKVAGLDSALTLSKSDGERLRARIREEMARGGSANVGELAAQLDLAEGRQRALAGAARVDYVAIAAANSPAVVFIAVEFAGGEVVSGSGFNVAPGGLVVTNRHVVLDEKGRPPKRIAVAFDNTVGFKPAHVLQVSETDELAFIKIDREGPFPVVAGIAKDAGLRVGAPVAIIGYPLSTSTAGMGGDISKLRPKSTLGVGTASKMLADTLQFDAYAAQGSSGSAVFDARGYVVGVLFGGARESNGRLVYAVPSHKLVAQLPSEGAAIVR